VARKKPLVR